MAAGSKSKGRIWVEDKKSKNVYLRDGFIVSFFLPVPVHTAVAGIAKSFQAYLSMIPPDVLRWESVGANSEEWRAVSKTTVKRCLDQLDPGAAQKRKISSFDLSDGDEGGWAPGYGVEFIGTPKDSNWPQRRSVLQFYFPAGAADDADGFVSSARALAEPLPFVSGYASPSLQYSPDLMLQAAMRHARKVAARYPGYDVHFNRSSALDQNDHVRGARWLTFLGPDIVKKLGGRKAIEKALSAPVTVDAVGHGLMIRASAQPELGDANAKQRTPGLRKVGKLLEPVTNFDDTALVGCDFAEDDSDPLLLAWQRRFVD